MNSVLLTYSNNKFASFRGVLENWLDEVIILKNAAREKVGGIDTQVN